MARSGHPSGSGRGAGGDVAGGRLTAAFAIRVRPRLWSELLLLVVCYGAYQLVRNLVPVDPATAAHRAREILEVEYSLHLDVEYDVNRVFAGHGWLATAGNYFYATMHFAATVAVMVWLYVRRPARYAVYRTLLFATTLLGLLGFWLFPLAPPRMLPGFTDTVAVFGTWGFYGSGPTASVTNQFAAMPSMHTAWSLWCAAAVIGVVRRRWAWLALLYPALTIVVIVGTANHFLLDAAGGVGALAGGALIAIPARELAWRLVPARPCATAAPLRDHPAGGSPPPSPPTGW
ncbi:phosphatase PAP2 family protein [Actinomadura sp. NEAU-AAG7]|uniref:phosphatase PAP2 family protein n=1 Tax=Actinomadura sp. NEAU-AAG7 TaxID=2839640 RepID=UPI0027E0857F|nr:phosphatase PAP2 family protein [Actinomadura sp. NEAU-AAG7]